MGAVPPRPSRTSRTLATLLRDPVLLGLLALTLFGWLLFELFADSSVRKVQVLWALQVPMDALLACGALRLRRLAPDHFRRFWSFIAFGGTAFTIGDSFQFVSTLLAPGSATVDGGTVQNVLFAVGMTSNVLACLTFPQGPQTGRERAIFWLDSTTVLVGGAVLAWCFAVNPVGTGTNRLAASLTVALVVVAAFAATKVTLCAHPPMDRIAAWPMVAAPVVQTVSAFLLGLFDQQDRPYAYTILLLPSLLITMGPRIQEITVRTSGYEPRVKRRPYSLLPYGMVALTFVMFLVVLPDDVSVQLWGAIVGIVVITALVTGRQLIAFQDNVRLIKRLDIALDNLRGQDAQLRWQAQHDPLSGLANRDHFQAEMARQIARTDARRVGEDSTSLTVLLIDLDDFKTINDTMGHAAGDALLVSVAQRLEAAVRPGDLAARLGGDEFAVLLPNADARVAVQVSERILSGFAEDVGVQQHRLAVRASIGIAEAQPGTLPSVLLSNADIAMYEAKQRGKGTWARYSQEMGLRINAEADMIRDLGCAVEAGQFALVYQPIVRLDDTSLTGVEALIRWEHPEHGLVSPVDFIPLAERSGHIVAIGRWVLREACRQAAAWRSQFPGAEHLTVGVNVAGRQLRSSTFVDEVADVLAQTGLPADRLSIEVTETAVLDDQESMDTLERLRELGVKLALDDFGTAASSLGLLLTCPVTTLKLDRSFVESIITVGRQAAVATAVSQMADTLHFTSVAEGIETEAQRSLLLDLGYQYGQGYLFSKPVTADDLAEVWTEVPSRSTDLSEVP